MMIICGYLIEFIILGIWYKWIVAKELNCKSIVRRSIKVFWAQRKNIFLHIMGRKESDEQEKYFCSIRDCLFELFMELCMFGGYIFLVPIFLKFLLQIKNSGLCGFGIYIFFVGGLVYKQLKEESQRIIKKVNVYVQNGMIPLERKPNLLKTNEEKELLIVNKRTVTIFSVCLVVIAIVYVCMEYFKENKVFQIICSVIFIFLMIRDLVSSRLIKKITNADKGICIENIILDSMKDDIESMCGQLKIENLECKIIETEKIYANSKINENDVPQINISNGFINLIYGETAKELLLVTIAHELGHIYYNDFSNIRKRTRRTNFVFLILFILNGIGVWVFRTSIIIVIIILLIMTIEYIFENVMCDVRYWQQIAELRADRMAINICTCSKMAFIDFWKADIWAQNKKKENMILQYYRRYIKVEGHPAMERRIELIEKRDKWHWWKYFEHVLIIIRWRMTNKGWNGK